MNKLSLIATLALVAAASAQASDIDTDGRTEPRQSGKTRAEVRAELLQARADGSIEVWKEIYHPYNAMVVAAERSARLAARPAAQPVELSAAAKR